MTMKSYDDKTIFDYLDGELDEESRERVEKRLKADDTFRMRYERLAATVAELRNLPEEAAPPRDLWGDIVSRIEAPTRRTDGGSVLRLDRTPTRRRFTFEFHHLAAAALAGVLIAGSATWAGYRMGVTSGGSRAVASMPARAAEATVADVASFTASDAYAGYESAIAQLEAVIEAGQDVLAPETREALDTAMATIEQAIQDAQQALENDPGSALLERMLSNAMQRKLELLRRTAAAVQTAA
jgi:anti-sigma-K factor RskA